MTILKKAQVEGRKRVNEAARVINREEPNLAQAKSKLEAFKTSMEVMGISEAPDKFLTFNFNPFRNCPFQNPSFPRKFSG